MIINKIASYEVLKFTGGGELYMDIKHEKYMDPHY